VHLARHADIAATSVSLPGRDRQRGIDRVIGVLELLQRRREPMSAGEIARALGAPRSTVYEIVHRLSEAEMLEPVGAEGRVFFGRAMHLFGAAYRRDHAGMRRIGEVLDSLSAETGATVQCCAMRGDKYVVLDCRDGAGAFRITSEIGAEVPLPWTASGRLLLAHLSDAAIRDFVPAEDFQLPDGRWLPLEAFLDDVARARRDGFSETTGLANGFTWCQAVPILDRDGVVASHTLCFVLPVDSDAQQRARCLALLREKAGQLSLAAAR
jgi:DNA-binding IclR family transcriptional regulator